MKLQDCIALVTGGGTGIGLETARMLKEQGAKVAVCGRRADADPDPSVRSALPHPVAVRVRPT